MQNKTREWWPAISPAQWDMKKRMLLFFSTIEQQKAIWRNTLKRGCLTGSRVKTLSSYTSRATAHRTQKPVKHISYPTMATLSILIIRDTGFPGYTRAYPTFLPKKSSSSWIHVFQAPVDAQSWLRACDQSSRK